MWFELGRSEGYPTQYGPNATPVTVDVLEAGLITAFVILGASFFVALPTTRLKTNLIVFTRVSITLLIGVLLLVNNFGQEWEVGHIVSKTPYRAGTHQEINASISVKIALRGVNVTLRNITDLKGKLEYEKIDYNERFEWTWDQGRFGFGPYAGHIQQQFRAAQLRGLPLPILWVVDYFVIDGEGFRFGRFYRTAGWYTHIVLWAAFACWLLVIILFRSVINYGAYTLGMCGILQIIGNLIWLLVRNPNPLLIPFEDAILKTKFGFNYWATLVTGIFCLILSIVILYMDYKYDQVLYDLFGINPLNSYDEVAYLTKKERLLLRPKNSYKPPSDIPLVDVSNDPQEDEDVDYIPVYLKRKTIVAAPKVSRKNKPKRYQPSTSEAISEVPY
ncbi:dual oxidase maturation factor 1 [Anoplophora glabripennis]|nr:dual oxidase maturation factor 1 [Anoplophora glabripennis]